VRGVTDGAVSCCRYCSGALPTDRQATFCPHCGLNLTTRQCPACSSELDVTWRFCVTCGRDASLPEDIPTETTDAVDDPVERAATTLPFGGWPGTPDVSAA
jgi:hypothetical protein